MQLGMGMKSRNGPSMEPLCIDLFSGLFGWGAAFAQEGYRVIGVDLEDMCGEFRIPRPEGCELIIRRQQSDYDS